MAPVQGRTTERRQDWPGRQAEAPADAVRERQAVSAPTPMRYRAMDARGPAPARPDGGRQRGRSRGTPAPAGPGSGDVLPAPAPFRNARVVVPSPRRPWPAHQLLLPPRAASHRRGADPRGPRRPSRLGEGVPSSQRARRLVEAIEGGANLSEAMARHPEAFDSMTVIWCAPGSRADSSRPCSADSPTAFAGNDEQAMQLRKALMAPMLVAGGRRCGRPVPHALSGTAPHGLHREHGRGPSGAYPRPHRGIAVRSGVVVCRAGGRRSVVAARGGYALDPPASPDQGCATPSGLVLRPPAQEGSSSPDSSTTSRSCIRPECRCSRASGSARVCSATGR